jgi:hypothetical protein
MDFNFQKQHEFSFVSFNTLYYRGGIFTTVRGESILFWWGTVAIYWPQIWLIECHVLVSLKPDNHTVLKGLMNLKKN